MQEASHSASWELQPSVQLNNFAIVVTFDSSEKVCCRLLNGMSDEYGNLRCLCRYLEIINSELETRIRQTQSDVAKMQDIFETINPIVHDVEPKENEEIAELLNKAKGVEMKETKPKPVIVEPFEQFQQCLKEFSEIPALKRDQFPKKFISGLVEHTRKTPAHLFERLTPCIKRLNQELDKVLKTDMEQEALAFKATYVMERAGVVADAFENEISCFEKIEEIDIPFTEREEKKEEEKIQGKSIVDTMETVANFSQKQLSTLYRLRGEARSSLMMARIREKVEEVILPLLENKKVQKDKLAYLRIASRGFNILSVDPRSYAIVTESVSDEDWVVSYQITTAAVRYVMRKILTIDTRVWSTLAIKSDNLVNI